MRGRSGGDEGQDGITSSREGGKWDRTSDTHQFPIWLGVLALAEVGKCPSRVPLHCEPVVLAEECQKRPQGALLEDVISANRAVTGDISQGPNGLFTDVESRGREQLDELWDGVGVNNHLGVVSGTGGNIC